MLMCLPVCARWLVLAVAQKRSLPKITDFIIQLGSREPEVRDVDHPPLPK